MQSFSENGEGAVIGCGGMSSDTAEALLKEEQIRTLHSVSLLDAAYLEFQNAIALCRVVFPASFCFRADSYIDGYTENLLREKEGAVCYDLTDTTVLWDDNLIVSSVAGKGRRCSCIPGQQTFYFAGRERMCLFYRREMMDAEILVFTEHPVGAGRLSPEYTLVSAYADTAAACFQTVGENCGWLAATGGEGNLVVNHNG